MKNKYVVGGLALLLVVSGNCLATAGDVGVGVKAGTLGAGVEVVVGVQDDLTLRAGLNYLTFDFDTTISSVDYTMEPNFKNATMLLDWHPFGGIFRFTGGFSLNDNTVDVSGTANPGLIPAGYGQYAYLTNLARLQGTVKFNSFAPYAGIGLSTGINESGWGVSCDLGVLFQGAATVSDLKLVTGVDYGAYQGSVNEYLAVQEKAIQDELDKYEYYPVVSVMLNYMF